MAYPKTAPASSSVVRDGIVSPRNGGVVLLYTVLGLIHLILWIIAAVEIIAGGKPLLHKVIWLLLILFVPLVGLIIYNLVGRSLVLA